MSVFKPTASIMMLCSLLLVTSLASCRQTETVYVQVTNDTVEETDSDDTGDVTQCLDAGVTNDGSVFQFSDSDIQATVTLYSDEIVRITATAGDDTADPTDGKIAIGADDQRYVANCWDNDDHYLIRTGKVSLRVTKDGLTFAMYGPDNTVKLWAEESPLSFADDSTTQTLSRGSTENFYGGGMQNGYFSHRGQTLTIAVPDFSDASADHWGDGGHPNPAPFYMSTNGYGVFRNTFAPGEYAFENPLKLSHDESHFDAFYFYGPDLKTILDHYTEITGRPFLAPIYGFELGHADCYNDDGTTADVLDIAMDYRDNDMPAGWVLPNDGYSCGYTDLEQVVADLDELGFYTGLWTEDGLDQIAWEVGTAGTRAMKLDIVWVYLGYEFTLDAMATAASGIEDNSDARRFVWSTMGWAGSQRYAVMWTGDNYGGYDYIRMQVPTVIGSGLSGQVYATGDIDGIFYGGADTYVRDLQWKTFIPVSMNMSGWAPDAKVPWAFGEPYTSYNRTYLKLKMRLMPYLYSYAAQGHQTGVPVVRAMVLEFPDDAETWGPDTAYQFMSGEWFLVAPMVIDSDVRYQTYFPEGDWIDYWDGSVITGPTWLDSYDAPLEKLPLFVKAGAIVPMQPEMLHHREKTADPLTLDIYPAGSTRFELYEDDGVTRAHENGAYSTQDITSDAPQGEAGVVTITVGAAVGNYSGKPASRGYLATVHTSVAPNAVTLNSTTIDKWASQSAFDDAATGWWYDSDDRGGILWIKTGAQKTSSSFTLAIARN